MPCKYQGGGLILCWVCLGSLLAANDKSRVELENLELSSAAVTCLKLPEPGATFNQSQSRVPEICFFW